MVTPIRHIRAALLDVVQAHSEWSLYDEADLPEGWHPPCALLLKTVTVAPDSFGVRRLVFTVRLLTSADDAREAYDSLLDAIGPEGYIEWIEAALRVARPEWTTAMPLWSTSITEEVYGQSLLQQADISVEVWT